MKKFAKDLAERAIKTAAQAAIAAIGTTALLQSVDWRTVASVTALATIMSVLTSIASYKVGEPGTASLAGK
ncbi:MAG: holin [Oscillospiraceae bacterium]|jgi:hypothetical protein|nr:holin [Oscillospiraceae bacterium]